MIYALVQKDFRGGGEDRRQEQQAAQLEAILTLTDTLISVMHRRLVYSHTEPPWPRTRGQGGSVC
jgi:hypothetical protein